MNGYGPEEDLDRDMCIEIPHKNDLDLGQNFVFEFVERNLAVEYHSVQQIFQCRGAYGRFKDLLERKDCYKAGTILRINDRNRYFFSVRGQ